MPVNYFIGQTLEWLEKELALCQQDISRGKTLMQWGAGDSQGSSKIQLTPQVRYEQIYYALTVLEDREIAAGVITEAQRYYPKTNKAVRRTTPRYIRD